MSIFSAIGNVVGALLGSRDNKKQRKATSRENEKARGQADKEWRRAREAYHVDRQNERNYLGKKTTEDRKFAENLTAKDRAYAEKMLFGERDYARKITTEDRAYNERMLSKDRKYAESVYEKEKRDLKNSKTVDQRLYKQDRAKMQAVADKQAIRTAASRGIDFERLRDDAVKAGFNPLTAMQWASAYSTETGFGVMGDVYSGSASTPSQTIPGRAAGGSTVAAGGGSGGAGTPMVSSIVPGTSGFSAPGGGYGVAQEVPAMSSSSFLAEALGELVDTGYNMWTERQERQERGRAEYIADQVARGQLAREYDRRTPRNFGYNLAKIEPFRPAVSVYAPPVGPGDLDPVHDREVEVQPVPNTPLTSTVDIGGGRTVRGFNPDLDNEILNAMNVPIYGIQGLYYGVKDQEKRLQDWAESQPYNRGRGQNPRVPAGTGSYALTGSRPVWPVFGGH